MLMHKEDLDGLSCQSPGCDHSGHDGLVLNSRCHSEGTKVIYQEGKVIVNCYVCDKPIVEIAVASRIPVV